MKYFPLLRPKWLPILWLVFAHGQILAQIWPSETDIRFPGILWKTQEAIREASDALHRIYLPSSLQYKSHFSRQLNCCSLRCSWSIACRRCSNYISNLHLTLGFNILRKDSCKPRRETFKFWDLVRLILAIYGSSIYVIVLGGFMCYIYHNASGLLDSTGEINWYYPHSS